MKKFREYLKEELKDKEFEKSYYEELERTRIAVEITLFREKKGLTQAELAKLIGTSQSAIARIESPDYKNYSISTLRKIAVALELELVVSLKEKGEEIHEGEQGAVYYVTNLLWQKKKEGYRFNVSPEVSPKKDFEEVA